MLATETTLSASDAAAKWLAPHYAAIEIIWVRSLLGFAPAALLCARSKGGFRTRQLRGHILRSLLMLGAWALFIDCMRVLPLADAFAIAFASPIAITLAGRILLREYVSGQRFAAVIVGFVGVLVILQPGAVGASFAAAEALLATLLWALSTIVSRRLSATESSETMLFYYMLCSLIGTSLVVPWVYVTPAAEHALAFFITAIAGTLGHWLMAQACRYAEVSLLAPFEYFAIVSAIALGYLIWGDVPAPLTLAGVALIMSSGLFIAREEAAKQRVRSER
jgi:drug/metabolite transporter (DMT)-like permease